MPVRTVRMDRLARTARSESADLRATEGWTAATVARVRPVQPDLRVPQVRPDRWDRREWRRAPRRSPRCSQRTMSSVRRWSRPSSRAARRSKGLRDRKATRGHPGQPGLAEARRVRPGPRGRLANRVLAVSRGPSEKSDRRGLGAKRASKARLATVDPRVPLAKAGTIAVRRTRRSPLADESSVRRPKKVRSPAGAKVLLPDVGRALSGVKLRTARGRPTRCRRGVRVRECTRLHGR